MTLRSRVNTDSAGQPLRLHLAPGCLGQLHCAGRDLLASDVTQHVAVVGEKWGNSPSVRRAARAAGQASELIDFSSIRRFVEPSECAPYGGAIRHAGLDKRIGQIDAAVMIATLKGRTKGAEAANSWHEWPGQSNRAPELERSMPTRRPKGNV